LKPPDGDVPHGRPTMIVRAWSARATPEGAVSYRRHFQNQVMPALKTISGQRGALLLSRVDDADTELVVLTFWESMDAVRTFAGTEATTAVVAPEAGRVLKDFDREVRMFEVVLDARA